MATHRKRTKSTGPNVLSLKRRLLVVSGMLLVPAALAWGALLHRSDNREKNHRPREFDGAAGPWGKLHYKRIWLQPPEEVLGANSDRGETRWFFGGFTPDRLVALFHSIPMPAQTVAALTETSRWRLAEGGIWVMPPLEAAASLEPQARARLYDALAPFPENGQHKPVPFQADLLDERLEAGHLSPNASALLRRLLYPRDPWLLFADEFLALSLLPDRAQRARFLDVLVANPTYLVTLEVNGRSDLDGLIQYWALGTRPDGRAALLRAAAAVPQGSSIELAMLLPPLVRRLLYTYPNRAVDPGVDRHNCYWTALNFFSDAPEDRFGDVEPTLAWLRAEYDEVNQPTYGDVVLLLDAEDAAIHAAVYLADRLVFTKNGGNQFQPWMYMTVEDMLAMYSLTPSPGRARPVYLRRRHQPPG